MKASPLDTTHQAVSNANWYMLQITSWLSLTMIHLIFTVPLSERHICLDACHPKFLCEKILDDMDEVELNRRMSIRKSTTKAMKTQQGVRSSFTRQLSRRSTVNDDDGDEQLDNRSSTCLLGETCLS